MLRNTAHIARLTSYFSKTISPCKAFAVFRNIKRKLKSIRVFVCVRDFGARSASRRFVKITNPLRWHAAKNMTRVAQGIHLIELIAAAAGCEKCLRRPEQF